jgi:hypothetical protein
MTMAPTAKKKKPLGWTKLNDAMRDADEITAKKMLDEEKKNENRLDFKLRIYKRYNKMRRQREIEEMISESNKEA